jgi:hypothetical protein
VLSDEAFVMLLGVIVAMAFAGITLWMLVAG